MSSSILPEPALPFAPNPAPSVRTCVTVQERISVPDWVHDFSTFRRWAHSDEYPEFGQVAYLNGEIWVDPSMEELITHNKVKSAFAFAIMSVLQRANLGEFIADRMLLTHPQVDLSTEPDGLAYVWPTLETKKLVPIEGKSHGYTELSGAPDIVLEVVSESSVRKDTVTLRDLYWRADIAEYWLVDARSETPSFEILRKTETGYESTPMGEGWQSSPILGHSFRLVRYLNPVGMASFTVELRAER
jgi:Uma2 family endonuclease